MKDIRSKIDNNLKIIDSQQNRENDDPVDINIDMEKNVVKTFT